MKVDFCKNLEWEWEEEEERLKCGREGGQDGQCDVVPKSAYVKYMKLL